MSTSTTYQQRQYLAQLLAAKKLAEKLQTKAA